MKILHLLEENKDKTLSGQVIADTLSMTRANVWKEITKLRLEGYEIIATPSKGYQLTNYNQNFSKYTLEANLDGLDIEIYKSLNSTNELAKESNQTQRLIIAQTQTKGRGRMGRSFYSPQDKGLYFSYVIDPKLELDKVPLITIAAACAVHKALPVNTDIKWLNDILINQKKLVGILVEGDIELQTHRFNKIIVGVGINLFKSDVPDELKDIMGSLEEFTNKTIDKHQILIDFIHEFDELVQLIGNNEEDLIKRYRKHCITINQKIRYLGKEYKAIDINQLGQLIVEDEFMQKKIIQSGEIDDQN